LTRGVPVDSAEAGDDRITADQSLTAEQALANESAGATDGVPSGGPGSRASSDGGRAARPISGRKIPSPEWPDSDQVRRLLHVPAALSVRLDMPELVPSWLAGCARYCGPTASRWRSTMATAAARPRWPGRRRPVVAARHAVRGDPLPLTAPLRGILRILAGTGSAVAPELAELTAQRMHCRGDGLAARRRPAPASLDGLPGGRQRAVGQSMDVELVVTLVPQVVVPRLGQWCAVHLLDEAGQLRLAALTHATDDTIPDLRAALDPSPPPELARQLSDILAGSAAPAGSVSRRTASPSG